MKHKREKPTYQKYAWEMFSIILLILVLFWISQEPNTLILGIFGLLVITYRFFKDKDSADS
jgi:hypothetical protein